MSENGTQGAKVLEAIGKVMADTGTIGKSGFNKFHTYAYATEEDVLKELRPAMVEHGLILLPSCIEHRGIDEFGNTHLILEYHLAHISGDVLPFTLKIPGAGNDKNSKGGVTDKGTFKALTGANKYALFKIFQIATADDPEQKSHADEHGTGKSTASPPSSTNGHTNSTPPEKPACPECGQFEMVMPSKEEWGGGWYCWKEKGGCGAVWGKKPKEEAPAPDGPTIDRKEANAMTAHAKSCDVSPELLREKIKSLTGLEKLSSLTHAQRDLVIAWIDRGAPPVGDEPATKAQLDEIDKIGAKIEDMQLEKPEGVNSLGTLMQEMGFKISTLTQAEANRLITALKAPF